MVIHYSVILIPILAALLASIYQIKYITEAEGVSFREAASPFRKNIHRLKGFLIKPEGKSKKAVHFARLSNLFKLIFITCFLILFLLISVFKVITLGGRTIW